LDIETLTVFVNDFTEQVSAPVPELGLELTVLITRVRGGDRFRSVENTIPGGKRRSFVRGEPVGIKPQLFRQLTIHANAFRIAHRLGLTFGVKVIIQINVGVFEFGIHKVSIRYRLQTRE
jgi:hypothetical protein